MTYPPNGGPIYPGPPSGPYYSNAATVARGAQRSRRRTTWLLAAIVAILALLVGIGAVQLYSSKTGKDLIPWLTLRSANDPGEDPFTPSVSLAGNAAPVSAGSAAVASYQGSQVVNGTDPGLYATGAGPSCDAAGLNNYLANNPAAADAWAGVFGIRRADIPWYINTLSPVLLTHDTWVTNHTYKGGTARPLQSVLQAGTPVFVDGAGVPRVVCACGNPLLPPSAAPVRSYRTTGHPWPGYDRARTTKVATNNTYVTTINNVTTVVNRAPAPLTPLQVMQVATGLLATIQTSGLDLPPAPADLHLPDPATANATPKFADAAVAAEQGMQQNSDLPAENLTTDAPQSGPVQDDTESVTTQAPADPSSPDTSVPSTELPGVTTPSTGTTTSPTTESTTTSPTTTSTSTSAEPTPTSFSGSGDTVGSFTFTDGSTDVTCTVPSSETESTVSLSCSDDVARTVSASSLSKSSVESATSNGVWTLTLSSSSSVRVTRASYE